MIFKFIELLFSEILSYFHYNIYIAAKPEKFVWTMKFSPCPHALLLLFIECLFVTFIVRRDFNFSSIQLFVLFSISLRFDKPKWIIKCKLMISCCLSYIYSDIPYHSDRQLVNNKMSVLRNSRCWCCRFWQNPLSLFSSSEIDRSLLYYIFSI